MVNLPNFLKFILFVLFLNVSLFDSVLFADSPSPISFSTYIGITETNGIVDASVFLVESKTEPNVDRTFFDNEMKKYMGTGSTGVPDQSPTEIVDVNIKIIPLKDAELYFFYYDKTGSKINIPGCAQPTKTSFEGLQTIITTGTGTSSQTPISKFYYARCNVPKTLYEKTSIIVYVEYKGNQIFTIQTLNNKEVAIPVSSQAPIANDVQEIVPKPSQREITIYDVEAGGLNVFTSAVERYLNKTDPVCLAGLIMLGILLASMYFSGKSPFTYLDITVPRLPKPKAFGFGQIVTGSGNIRMGMSYVLEVKFLDAIIKRHSKIDFRSLDRNIENAIAKSKATEVQKYYARLEASRNRDWQAALKADARDLLMNTKAGRYGNIPVQLQMVMNNRVNVGKAAQSLGVVGGDVPKRIVNVVKIVRQSVPLIGPWLSVATSSFFYTIRTAKYMGQSVVSKPVRLVMGRQYQQITADEKSGTKPAGLTRWIYNVASMTDTKKIVVGNLFPIDDHAKRFYDDTSNSLYEEVVKNILWKELYDGLRQQNTNSKNLLLNQLDFKNIFKSHSAIDEIINGLARISIPQEYITILGNANITSRERAELMLNAARGRNQNFDSSELGRAANSLYNRVNRIALDGSLTSYAKAEQLVKHMRETYHVDRACDLTDSITNGKFFITTGRNNLYFEENGVKKNFGFLTLALREYMDQMVYLSAMKNREVNFTIADAFKIAWLKLASQVFGHKDWYIQEAKDSAADFFITDPISNSRKGYKFDLYADGVTVTDPLTHKPKTASFIRDILGMNGADLGEVHNKMSRYMHDLMSPEGQTVMQDRKKRPDNFLYGFDILDTKRKEETNLNPYQKQQWYYMESETRPDQKYWRANMNFAWTSIGQLDQRCTLVHSVRGYKYWANMPRSEKAWTLIEEFMDTRLANMMNGGQLDVFGYEQKEEQFKRFSRVNMQKHFNETWEFYSKVNEGLEKFYALNPDAKTSGKVTYDMLRNSKMPWIYTNDLNYIPYVKGMPVSDFDRVINGVYVVEDKDRNQRTFDFLKMSKYMKELNTQEGQELQRQLEAVAQLKKAPSSEDIGNLRNALTQNLSNRALSNMQGLLNELNRMHTDPANPASLGAVIQAVENIRNMIIGLSISKTAKSNLLQLVDNIDPNRQAMRALTQAEFDNIQTILNRSNISPEAKTAFLLNLSRSTHEWQNLWANTDFLKLVPESEVGLERGAIGKFIARHFGADSSLAGIYNKLVSVGRTFTSDIEAAAYATGKYTANAMASHVSTTELYRERSHEMRLRIKTGGFLNDLNISPEDKQYLFKAYNNYADRTQSYYSAYVDGVTRDPRGGSTQWGMQWYLAAMYHRGGAMHPESHEYGMERSFLSPLGWLFGQTFHRASALNWMLASPYVKMMRGFQSAAFGYPTIWDKGIAPGGEFDALAPWQRVTYPSIQKYRALLNPLESVFSLKGINPIGTMLRSLQLIPGLNMLSYFFPRLDPTGFGGQYKRFGKNLGDYSWFQNLSKIPTGFGLRSFFQQSLTQKSQRSGAELVNALKQRPEDFPQYKGGFVHHFTDQANPGISHVTYTGGTNLAPRIASYLTRDLTSTLTKGNIEADAEKWRKFYNDDDYVRRQASSSMVRRNIAAEAKRLAFQEELTGYGPWQNPMWAPIGTPFLSYHAAKWLGGSALSMVPTTLMGAGAGTLIGGAVPAGQAAWYAKNMYQNWKTRSRKPDFKWTDSIKEWGQRKYANIHGGHMYVCPHCNQTLVIRGKNCPNPKCRSYII